MLVTYTCKCGETFDGHWHRAPERLKQFPHLKGWTPVFIAMVCPACGNKDHKRNDDCDEDFTPVRGGGDDDED